MAAIARTYAAPIPWRWLALAATAAVVGMLVASWGSMLAHPAELRHELGGDFRLYTDAARRWLSGGSFYADFQTAPYVISAQTRPILYPPTMLALLVPFTVLPAVLWWVIPIGVTVAVVAHHRPAMWAWPLLLLPLLMPHAGRLLVNGTPTIWLVAVVAVATLRPHVAALVLLKPSLAPFALLGARDRRWWILAAVITLAMIPALVEYVTILRNSNGSLLYSLTDVPLLAIPLVAWAARQSRM